MELSGDRNRVFVIYLHPEECLICDVISERIIEQLSVTRTAEQVHLVVVTRYAGRVCEACLQQLCVLSVQ